MKAKVYFFEVSFYSIFVGNVAETFATKEDRDEYTDRCITPYSLGSDPAVLGIRFNDGSFLIDEDEAEEWENDGFKVIYPDYY